MRTFPECLPCIVKQSVDSSRMVTKDDKTIIDVMRVILKNLSESDLSQSPPEIVSGLQSIIRSRLKNPDPYRQLKERSTQKALELAREAEKAIKGSEDPFSSAVAFAIAGNILDFAKNLKWDDQLISETFSRALYKAEHFSRETIASLYDDIKNSRTVLILGDNAGEAVFDRIFTENIPGQARIYYAVKSSPVLNDITTKEALDAGLDKTSAVISNGADIPGTVLSRCSADFRELFYSADTVISKGQGNFETLDCENRKIWFLFQVKCPVIARHCGYQLGSWVILPKGA